MRFVSALVLFLFVSTSAQADFQRFVNQTNIFSGEVASNLTIGAPLSVDINGKLTSGLPTPTFVGVAGTITVATNAAYATMTSLTLSPVTAGTYQVHCRTSIAHTTNNAAVLMAVFNNAVIVADSISTGTPFIQGGVTPSLAVPMVLYSNTETTISAGQAISCGWRTSAGTASSTPTRSIMITRIR